MIIDSYKTQYNEGKKDSVVILSYNPKLRTPAVDDVLASRYISVNPAVSTSMSLFITEYDFTPEDQTINRTVHSFIRYQIFDPYTIIAQIRSTILESIGK
ncbi:unnamed protein product [Adineta steineri]|uniref:Uncharacterized protein n=1 Tax=Adineta steineri TaxID=433720 RepID=A0A814TX08_9BILA|nr:unnamed protein product [Adineta steineri]CAF1167511.1 unnamed protein product [Adineta steineri]CAF4058585.1 unnamed protein product [Adineta steineri]CAF4079553.1 unnamed protein product [Adineta steineri]